MSKKMICTLRFERVKKEENRKVMYKCETIADTDSGVKVVQSPNKNVITIIHNGYMNHVILEDVVNQVLEHSEELI